MGTEDTNKYERKSAISFIQAKISSTREGQVESHFSSLKYRLFVKQSNRSIISVNTVKNMLCCAVPIANAWNLLKNILSCIGIMMNQVCGGK